MKKNKKHKNKMNHGNVHVVYLKSPKAFLKRATSLSFTTTQNQSTTKQTTPTAALAELLPLVNQSRQHH